MKIRKGIHIVGLIILLNSLINLCAIAQNTCSGFIRDAASGEALIGATLYNVKTGTGVVSNAYGFYSIEVPNGENQLQVRYVGYRPLLINLNLVNDTLMTINLEAHNVLGDVEVKARKAKQFLSNTNMGVNRLSGKSIEQLPVVLGEADVLKAVQMLPGVTSGSEGTSGISVRGGSPDHTLILLDDVPVYNVNHLFGYFSTFNSQAISDVQLIKGAIPSRYGGRLASVLDVRMKEGNSQQFKADLSIGTLSAKGTIEGPIAKGRGSYMVSLRKTWPDLPLYLYYGFAKPSSQFAYGFHDFNAKANWRFNQNNRVYVSFYTGNDRLNYLTDNKTEGYRDEIDLKWGNYTGSLRWNRILSPKHFVNYTAYYSQYRFVNHMMYESKYDEGSIDLFRQSAYSLLHDISLKSDFDYRPNNSNHIRYGAALSHKISNPYSEFYNVVDGDTTQQTSGLKMNSESLEMYVDDDFTISDKLTLNAGLRGSVYYTDGAIKAFLLPRLSLAWRIADPFSVKVGYSRMAQNIHQLSNPNTSFSTDLWVASTKEYIPSTSNLFSMGAYYMPNDIFSFSVEAYYSKLNNVIGLKPEVGNGWRGVQGEDLNWTNRVYQGKGKAYGIELMAEKKLGLLTGMMSYTWSRSLRSYDELVNGEFYPYDYDRPHKFSAFATYTFRHHQQAKYKKSITANFTYSSGKLVSIPTAQFSSILPTGMGVHPPWWADKPVYYTPYPNNYRMRSFHHLDLSFQLESLRKEKGSWTFGVYNVYNQFNASIYTYKKDKLYEIALFPVMPFVSWKKSF